MSLKKIITLKGRVTELNIDVKVNKDNNRTWSTSCMLQNQKIYFHTSKNTHISKSDELIVSGTIGNRTLQTYAYKNLSRNTYHYGHIFSSFFLFFIGFISFFQILILSISRIFDGQIKNFSLLTFVCYAIGFVVLLMMTIDSLSTFIHSIRANIALFRFKKD